MRLWWVPLPLRQGFAVSTHLIGVFLKHLASPAFLLLIRGICFPHVNEGIEKNRSRVHAVALLVLALQLLPGCQLVREGNLLTVELARG